MCGESSCWCADGVRAIDAGEDGGGERRISGDTTACGVVGQKQVLSELCDRQMDHVTAQRWIISRAAKSGGKRRRGRWSREERATATATQLSSGPRLTGAG